MSGRTRTLSIVGFALAGFLHSGAANARVAGDLRLHSLRSAKFGNERLLRVLVPPGYDAPQNRDRRYPVLFLNDGQNLFDASTAVLNPMEWGVDETVRDLQRSRRIPSIIIVGIDNAGRRGRFKEYFPWVDPQLHPPEPDPQGERYPAFVVDEVVPFIQKKYRVSSDSRDVGIGGSSAGALAAAYAAIKRPGVFGKLLLESPALYLDDYHLMREAAQFARWPDRIYLGAGTNEGNADTCDATAAVQPGSLADDLRRLGNQLRESGVRSENLRLRIVPCAKHDEHAWGRRLPEAIEFLFGEQGAVQRIIPTRYDGDRFYAMPVTQEGDTMSMFLDTGGGTLIFRPAAGQFRLKVDSVASQNGQREVASFPLFQPGSELPDAVSESPQGRRLLISEPKAGLAAMIFRDAAGQLGRLWFADQVWTLDFVSHRVYWHGASPPPSRLTVPPARRVDLAFEVDSAGKKKDHFAYFPITIDGESLKFFLDTGAQIWLTPGALAAVNDGGPIGRAICILRDSVFERLRKRHPDWRAIDHADSLSDEPILEVPHIDIGGISVGPVWFKSFKWQGSNRPVTPETPFLDRPVDGGLSGSALKYLRVTIDYPRATAWFASR